MSRLKTLEPFTGFQRQLAKTLSRYADKPGRLVRHPECVYGIEIETEKWGPNAAIQDGLHEYWHFVGDGSLRGDRAMESVSYPLKGVNVVRAVRQWCKAVGDINPFTYRCSTHIHLNLLDLDTRHLPSLMLTCILVDNLMFTAGGGERRGNYNCRPASVLMEEVEAMADLSYHLATDDHVPVVGLGVFGDRNRYLGTNFAAIFKFGTVEFRHFPGTTSAAEILWWCDIIGDIYEFSKHATVQEIMEMTRDGADFFSKCVFEDHKKLTYREMEEDWLEALDTAHHFTNTLARLGGGRGSFHGFLQAEYVL